MLPASAVPVIVGLVFFVAPLIVVRIGLSGAVVSTVVVMAVELGDTFPAVSVAVAVIMWAPSPSGVDGVKVQAPVADALEVPRLDAPSKTVTVLLASAVPAIMTLPLPEEPLRVEITGLLGGVTSTVNVIAVDASEVLPAGSLALAVIVCAVAVSALIGVKDQVPSDPAFEEPKAITPS